MKENQTIQPVIDVEAGTVTFVTRGMPDLVLHIAKCHPDVQKRAALVGMAQVRIVDAAAISRTDDDGNLIPEPERTKMKHANMEALVAHYETGTPEWSRRGEGGGGRRSLTIEAIARVQGIEYDDAKAQVADFARDRFEGNTRKALAKLAEGERVARAMSQIRDERRGPPKADADALLDELTK